MSFAFIKENLFFSGLLLFQSLYLAFPSLRLSPYFYPLEIAGTFFPYAPVIRNIVPKSSFRISIDGTYSDRQGNASSWENVCAHPSSNVPAITITLHS
jgi:hypothetical protein